ncbi:MAG TPA: DUF4936 family protein [Zeimonas sp.]|nr:DUF4936 family protein [Zeimonas sp.]
MTGPVAMACVVMVWFRADPARNDECRRALAALGRQMRESHGVDARFGWRDEPGAGYRTWLETYEPVAAERCGAFTDALRSAAAALGLDALSIGGRHDEVFEWGA